MYFDEYDGPRTRIIERERLEEIRSSGLEATLDQAALDRMGRSRPLYIDKQPRLKGKRVYGYVELYDDPWLFETPVSPAPEDKRPSLLEQAAVIGDSLQVGDILRRKTFSEGDLNRALWLAIYAYRDNTDVIELLLDNGANANARGADGVTPLMAAIQRPAHVEVLLKKGARVRDRDRYGRDALELAQRAGDRDSVELLRNAASR